MKFGNSIFKTFFVSLCIVANTAFAYAQTASILPPAKTTFNDQNGNPLTSGTVDFYVPTTTTRKTTWQDSAKSTPNANPVVLDAGGRALIWGDGAYRQVVKDRNGNLIWDQTTSSAGSGSGSSVGDGLAVGTVIAWSGIVAPANYAFTNGQALSRTTYSLLYSNTTINTSGSCVGGNSTISGISDTTSISIGSKVESVCFLSTATVLSRASNSVTVDLAATITITSTVRFFPYGNGDGSTSFNIPDYRGQTLIGRNNMGGISYTGLTSTYFGVDPNGLNATGGSQSHLLSLLELPSGITSVGSNSITVAPTGGGTGVPITSSPGNISGALVPTAGGTVTVPVSSSASWGGTAVFSGNNNIQVTSNNTADTPHSLIQPSKTVNYIIKILPDAPLGIASISQLNTGVPNQLAGTNASGIWGNISVPTGLSVVSSALNFDIPSLTLKASPNAVNDFVIIYDAAGNATKKSTVGSISSAASTGVTNINGVTGGILLGTGLQMAGSTMSATNTIGGSAGPFTLGQGLSLSSGVISTKTGVQTNSARGMNANGNVLTTDCGNTIVANSGFFTITLPGVGGFPADCTVTIQNSDTRGKKLSGFPSTMTSSAMLWPGQNVTVSINAGAWYATDPGRWWKQNAIFNVDTGGNDGNDGQATGAANALKTLNGCRSVAQRYIDTASEGNGGVTCLVTAGQAFQEFVQIFFPLVGGGSLIFQGNGGQFTWKPINSGYAVQFGDLGVVGLTNVLFDTTGVTTPVGYIFGHNYGIVDVNTGVTINTGGISGSAFTCDFDAHFNINNGITLVNSISNIGGFMYAGCPNSVWDINGAHTFTTNPNVNRWVNVRTGTKMTFEGNVTFSGAITSSVSLVSGTGVLNNLSGSALPGGAPTPTTGGQYCTSVC